MKLLLDAIAVDKINDDEETSIVCVVNLDSNALEKLLEMEQVLDQFEFAAIITEDERVRCMFYGDDESEKGDLTFERDGTINWASILYSGLEVSAEIRLERLREHAANAIDTAVVIDCAHYIRRMEDDEDHEHWMDGLPPSVKATLQSDLLTAKARTKGAITPGISTGSKSLS